MNGTWWIAAGKGEWGACSPRFSPLRTGKIPPLRRAPFGDLNLFRNLPDLEEGISWKALDIHFSCRRLNFHARTMNSLLRRLRLPAAVLLLCGAASAFPPAPSYLLFGILRDEGGNTITDAAAEVQLLKDGVVVGKTPVTTGGPPDQTYELTVPIDAGASGTVFYSAKAVRAGSGLFSLSVKIGDRTFLPIEVKGSLQAGRGSERVRLDLTLGEDSDGDGIPDAWEFEQLFRSGTVPGPDGWDLSGVNRNGDLDGDGQSNYAEYIAGTSAGDPSEMLRLEIRELREAQPRLEFYGRATKTYTIEASSDLRTWTPVKFQAGRTPDLAASAGAGEVYTASAAGVVSVWCPAAPGTAKQVFRLRVR
jgi:hypothetical protein